MHLYLEFSDLPNKGVKFCCYTLSQFPQNAGHISQLNAFSHYILSRFVSVAQVPQAVNSLSKFNFLLCCKSVI